MNKNKILFIQPNAFKGIEKTSHPHAGIAYLAAYSIQAGYETYAIDSKYQGIDNAELLKYIFSINPDIVGITLRTPDYDSGKYIAKSIKNYNNSIKVIIGGAHVTGVFERSMQECDYFDFAVYGEGEITLMKLLENMHNESQYKDINGLIFRHDNKIIKNDFRPYIENMDELLYPAWQLFPLEDDLPLFSSRGCPFQCIFCQRVMGSKVRSMTPVRAIEEIQHNIIHHGMKFMQIEDEVFGVNPNWMHKFLDMYMSKGFHNKVKWAANSRVNIANYEIYKKMKKAGCIKIGFGIESGNNEILKNIKKGFTTEQAETAIELAKLAGLSIDAFFILGHPNETLSSIRDTINFACKLNTDSVSFGLMVPYPGTEIYEMAKRGDGNYVNFHENWGQYRKYFGRTVELLGITHGQLNRYQKQAYIEFYIRNFKIMDFSRFLRKYFNLP